MKKLHDRAVQAATRFVERRGYGVLGSDWSCEGLAGRIDVIAEDEDAIVFIVVTATDRSEEGFAECPITREQFEVLAAKWLTCNCPEGDIAVRFDRVDMLVVGESKALLRHHINAYGSSEALA